MKNLFELLFKGISLLAVLALALLGLSVLFYAFGDTAKVVQMMLEKEESGKMIAYVLKAIDLILLGVVIIIMSVGLYEILIKPIKQLPPSIVVEDFDDLKGMLIKVAIVVIAISFVGRVVTWDGSVDLMGFGIAVGAVILALSIFLKVKKDE